MTEKERVKRAILMDGPDCVPLFLFNKDIEQSDIVILEVVKHFMGEKRDYSEWGFQWERYDDTMGQPKGSIIKTWDDLEKLKIPDPFDTRRFAGVKDAMLKYGEKYYLASLALTGFTVMTFLRGFSDILVDIYIDREKVDKLADIVFGFEEKIIGQLREYGFDGVAFFDDWGTQGNLIISPQLWREFFKPRYKKQFDLTHSCGLDVYFHSCGYIKEIIPDLIEVGVDILNISQPNLYDIKELGKEFGGKVCFCCPVSYQTTSITGTREDIYSDIALLFENLGCYNGGLIGYVEEYKSIGLSDENYRHCVEGFRSLKYK
ncbi:MAG: hypothetical protein HPY74_06875 [Firmicutes bacterium]|nr:hypothetical protein [Bacillota bacterium]